MKITFSFSGFCHADIKEVYVQEMERMEKKNIEQENKMDVLRKLNSGEYMISLGDYVYENHHNEIIISDFESLD